MAHKISFEKLRPLDQRLILAARDGTQKKIQFLLERGADIHVGGEKPLEIAAKHGNFPLVQLF